MHYRRWLHYGGPGPAAMIGKWAPLENRFLDNVQPWGPMSRLGPCHQWMGSLTQRGYPKICDGGRQLYAHRLAWYLAYGDWPGRLTWACGNRRCVRVEHLRQGALPAGRG
jgi:hypothetical protein